MATDLNSSKGRKAFIDDNLSGLLSGINDTYGPVILDELLKRIENTIIEFNEEINSAFTLLKEKDKKRKEFYNEINDDEKEEGQSEWEKKLESIESK
tara:strand:+ start:795 stop:1085 length:291 start_codon:yes stop_codon:yes gene_type:complete